MGPGTAGSSDAQKVQLQRRKEIVVSTSKLRLRAV